ncbi:MAG: replicative DNA helicase [Bacteroidetes bacterium HGW-Bacteroidetes-22]|nr:MAG: replicative DNA helicase [Bacteroidetes bacterium HGW-Bacteroidetes-22]
MEETSNTTVQEKADNTRRRTRDKLYPAPDVLGKIPPQAVEVEEAVLGAILIEKNALSAVIDSLKPEVFYKESHKKIYSAVQSLFNRSEPVDIITVTNELRNRGDLEICGGALYIAQLTNKVTSSANIEFHARIVTQKFIQRELIRVSNQTLGTAYEESADVLEMLDDAQQRLFEVSENNFRRGYDTMQSLVKKAIDEVQKAKESEGHFTGVPSGFTDLDRITSGWQKTDLIVLAARPGMGKTAFTLTMARNMAVEHKRPVAVFSLEMGAVQLVTRLVASESQLPADKLRKGDLKDYEWEQLHARIASLEEAPIFIDDTPALSVFELRAKCRRLKEQYNIEMVMIDYIQLMTIGGGETKGNREQEISTISRSLKALAKELNLPVIVLSQLNRSVETRTGTKRPMLSDLRESGAIEQDADIVMFIYRPEYYKIDQYEDGSSTMGKGDIIIAKHRNGALADVRLRFVAQFARFEDDIPSEFGDYNLMTPGNGFDQPKTMTLPSRMNNEDVTF